MTEHSRIEALADEEWWKPQGRLTVAQYLEWADAHPHLKAELIDGEVVPKGVVTPSGMAPERARHSLAKTNVAVALSLAIKAAGKPCFTYVDGIGVAAPGVSTYIPDVVVQCGEPIDPDAQYANSPTIVVEIISPSTRHHDITRKLIGYFQVPSIAHYLIVEPRYRTVDHHFRRPDGALDVQRYESGTIHLSPPGIDLDAASLLPENA